MSFSATVLFIFDYYVFNHLKILLRFVFLSTTVGMWGKGHWYDWKFMKTKTHNQGDRIQKEI